MDVVSARPSPPASPLRTAIWDSARIDEAEAVVRILAAAAIPPARARHCDFSSQHNASACPAG